MRELDTSLETGVYTEIESFDLSIESTAQI